MRYSRLQQTDIDFFTDLFGKDRIRVGEDIIEDYSHDEMQEYGLYRPQVLLEALTTHEVSQVVLYANKHNIPITPRGAGTGLCGGCVPIYGGIVLSLARMNHILEIDEENMIAVVEPGVLLMELAAETEKRNLLYPPDPGEKSATIGGNVMTNAGGMRAIKYGVTRDYVRGMEVVLPTGEVEQFGGKIAKSSSGYSLKDLMIGSEGTLGIVTKLALKLVNPPAKSITLLVPFPSLSKCLEIVPKILNAAPTPTNLEFMEKRVIQYAEKYLGCRFPDKSAAAYIMVTYSGNSTQEIVTVYDCVAQLCLREGAYDVLISDTEERQNSIWQARGAFLEAIKNSTPGMDECDVVVPIHSIGRYLDFAQTLERDYGIRIASFGHAGDGNLHLYVCKDTLDDLEWQTQRAHIMQELYRIAIELGGQVSGEHGIGHAKREYLQRSVGQNQIRLMRAIKDIFDPGQIMNPGKVCG